MEIVAHYQVRAHEYLRQRYWVKLLCTHLWSAYTVLVKIKYAQSSKPPVHMNCYPVMLWILTSLVMYVCGNMMVSLFFFLNSKRRRKTSQTKQKMRRSDVAMFMLPCKSSLFHTYFYLSTSTVEMHIQHSLFSSYLLFQRWLKRRAGVPTA